ncbi:MAG: TrbI/VirB10 family protein [Candidatus Andeanibacterium colombiense]|uniref:TrbI/VirB10 family protein n=1 Tax=Candidatus Andeanibacterium colombiense TaxID=3121345 RepID=A0AAJ5X5M6_9SPHN|nr:MAG: TrbI/VirB10 family protein [Sphingomonadaceae bacterium]
MSDAAATNGQESADLRPVVRTSGAGNAGLWIFLGALLIGGLFLFQALSARRLEFAEPETRYQSGGGTISSLPPLDVPAQFAVEQAVAPPLPPATLPPPPSGRAPYFPERAVTRVVQAPPAQREAFPGLSPQPPAVFPGAPLPGPSVVYDASIGSRVSAAPGPAAPASAAADERVLATRLANPSVTVPKGTIIPAVLESALDSTRAGQVRAVVSRDVMGFDGSKVLIPRGSRLYGEYASDLNYGQNRALVRWTRLLRPDGAMINLDSPAADPLGRAGVKGKVNSHFWARFGSAILQTVLDIGAGVATRKVDDALVVALPGSTQNLSKVATEGQSQVVPTLTIKQGTSLSVFVAKDLDFSPVEQ